jgi:tRNA(Ile)-lysidine synthase
VLLHLLSGLRTELGIDLAAIHVNHGLSRQAGEWAADCRRFCERLAVPLSVETVKVEEAGALGLEAAARRARYAAFESVLEPGEMLLTAHHRDDQAETLLLQLLRGGGVHGLAAMPLQRPLGDGVLARPLLDIGREELRAYAKAHRLAWIDDPSNFDTSLERNYLRHTLIPQLAERRAGIREVLARSAGHFAESAHLLDELAEEDWQRALIDSASLSIRVLEKMSPERCRNLLRYHVRRLGLSLPEHRQLHRIQDEVMRAADDASPLVAWHGVEVRRYRDALCFMPPFPPLPDNPLPLPISDEALPPLPLGFGYLALQHREGEGVALTALRQGRGELRFRQGGEKLQPAGRRGHHALKKLYQEAGLPPWERQRRPLLYIDGMLAQVPGLWTAQEYAAGEGEAGVLLQWSLSAIENVFQNDDN